MFTTFVPHFNDHVHFLRTLQYFLMKFCSITVVVLVVLLNFVVSSITLIVTALKKGFHIISLSLLGAILGYFGPTRDILGAILKTFS